MEAFHLLGSRLLKQGLVRKPIALTSGEFLVFFKNRSMIYRISVVAGRTCQRKVSMTHQRETFELPPLTPRG